MKPVLQDMFYDPASPVDQQRGNCLQAALAALLELPLDDVPHFVQDHVDHDGDSVNEWHWWNRMLLWLHDRGLSVTSPEACDPEPGEHVLAMGPSPRGKGIHHVVINRDGQLAHDPHPDAVGLVSIQSIYMVRPLKTA